MAKKSKGRRDAANSFSVTNVKVALQCPRIFIFSKYYGKKPFPYSGVVLGSIVHDIIDKVVKKLQGMDNLLLFTNWDGSMNFETFCQAIEDFAYKLFYDKFVDFQNKFQTLADIERNVLLGWELIKQGLAVIFSLLRVSFAQYSDIEAINNVFIANEMTFKLPVPEVSDQFTLTGRVDSLWMNVATQDVFLIDFKTGSTANIDTDFSQVALYAYAIYKKLLFKPRFQLYYLSHDAIDVKEGTWADVEALLPNAFEIMKKMQGWALDKKRCPKTPMPRMCLNCHLYSFCKRYFAHDPPPTKEELAYFAPEVSNEALNEVSNISFEAPPPDSLSPPAHISTAPDGEGLPPPPVLDLPAEQVTTEPEILHIGHLLDDPHTEATLDVKPLNRHVAILGTSGGGKTWLAKVIIEELLLQGYSSILIDPQGDLCSLLLPADAIGKVLRDTINFKIFTPGSKKGIPLSLNLFESMPPSLLDDDEYVNLTLDHLSMNILNTLGIEMKKGVPPQKTLLESIIRDSWIAGEILNFQTLAGKITEAEEISTISTGQTIPINQLIPPHERIQLAQKLTSLSAGTEGILFSTGQALDIPDLLNHGPSCYIINLQSLGTDPNKRQLVLSWIMQQIYNWMLTHPQADQDALRLFFYIDEVADFLPIHPNNPPSKKLLMSLLRQARKYGVGIILATQSPGAIEYKALDNVNTCEAYCSGVLLLSRAIEYKALDNVNTLFVGKTPTKQSSTKINDLISPYLDHNPVKLEQVMTRIRKLNPGEFFLIHPGNTTKELIKVRPLHTKHETISPDRIQSLLKPTTLD